MLVVESVFDVIDAKIGFTGLTPGFDFLNRKNLRIFAVVGPIQKLLSSMPSVARLREQNFPKSSRKVENFPISGNTVFN